MYEEARRARAASSPPTSAPASVLDALRAFGYAPRGAAPTTPRRSWPRPTTLYREQIDAAPAQAGRRRRSTMPPARPRAGSGARRSSTPPSPPSGRCRRCERRSPGSASTSTPSANVELDIEARPGKRPRAFCAPIRVPGRVVLVMLPQGGQDDYQALFHEAGPHRALRATPTRGFRPSIGSSATTPSPRASRSCSSTCCRIRRWLRAHSSTSGRSRSTSRFTALHKLFFVRRYAAKLAYEIELHAGTRARHAARPLRRAAHGCGRRDVPARRTTSRTSTTASTAPATCARGRSRPQLRDHLRSRFGRAWFADAARPATLLREMWGLGQSLRADELLPRARPASRSDFAVLADEARAALR